MTSSFETDGESDMTQQAKSPYAKIVGAGPAYEYGHTVFNMKNRRKDRDVPEGVADTYELACAEVGIKPRYLSDEMLPPIKQAQVSLANAIGFASTKA